MPNLRHQLSQEDLIKTMEGIGEKAGKRALQNGYGAFCSSHEILGILVEEMLEFERTVHRNQSPKEKIEELKDIAVAAAFGIASIQAGGTDW